MRRIPDIMLKRLARNDRGAMIVEFAVTLPVMLVLYIGGACVSDMIAANRKVTIATRALGDLTSRAMSPTVIYNDPSSANARSYLSASAVVLSPYNLSNATEQISLVRVCDSTHAYVAWAQAQTQSADGSTMTVTTPDQTAGTLPTNEAQSSATVISIPTNMVTSAMVPTSPDGSNVCNNLNPGTSTKTQVGTAGGWLFMSKLTYNYSPAISFGPVGPRTMTHTIYMVPRLY